MNDLDLRAALHRDADLAGEPAPDLLDQLVRRRVHQRRRRTAVLATVAGVLVIGAGIPVGQSFLTSSDTHPATQTTVDPTPSVAPTPSVSPEAPPPAATPAPTTPPTAAVSTSPAMDPDPPCDWDAMKAAMPADTAEHTYRLVRGDGELCSGVWAASGYSEGRLLDGQWVTDGQAGIFRYEDGSWVFHLRGDFCDKVTLPDAIWQRACNVD
jgi:hypothetical protein